MFDTYGGGVKAYKTNQEADASQASDDEGGVKLVEIDSCDLNSGQEEFFQLDQKKIGVMLTKQPNAPMTVQVGIKNEAGLEVARRQFHFTPENWQEPQIIEESKYMLGSTKATITAKADNAGGFKGTERDELKMTTQQAKTCGKNSITTLIKDDTWKTEADQEATTINENYIELESPFFIILKALLQPVFLTLSMISTFSNSIKPQPQKEGGEEISDYNLEHNEIPYIAFASSARGAIGPQGNSVHLLTNHGANEAQIMNTSSTMMLAPQNLFL